LFTELERLTELFVRNVITIRTCATWFKRFKTMISISVIKNAPDALQLWKEELRKDGKKLWKTIKNTSI